MKNEVKTTRKTAAREPVEAVACGDDEPGDILLHLHGEPFSRALGEAGLLPPSDLALLAIGERSGALAEVLRELADLAEETRALRGQILAENKQVKKLIAAFSTRPGMPTATEDQIVSGEMDVELVPQGTLVERCRAGGAGIPAFYSATVAGTVAHKAIELSLNWPGEPAPSQAVDEAIERLIDRGDGRAEYLQRLEPGERAELRSRAVDRTTKFLQDFPPMPANSQPVLESSVRWQPRGTIEFSGKVDLVVGRPEGRESRLLVVDFKSGSRSPQHRDDLRFYALLLTLRNKVPPRRLVTHYLDYADHEIEDVTEGVLRSALARTLDGIERHIELVVEGREPVKRPGHGCRWCPVLHECSEGAAHLRSLVEGSQFTRTDLL